ncbi:MAG: hypothetical protein L6Q78_08815 [Bacteroidia bacterium]|nr:hypothetical protein [Bacteroidia bacterium]
MNKIRLEIILDYKTVYGTPPPTNKIELLNGLNLNFILIQLAGINYKLKPKNLVHPDLSPKTQLEILSCFTNKIDIYLPYFSNKDQNPIIFNRYACLIGIEEILATNNLNLFKEIDENKNNNLESFLKFYLAINQQITEMNLEKIKDFTIESINPSSIPVNESMIYSDPIFTAYRGKKLFEWLNTNINYSTLFKEFLKKTHNTDPFYLIYRVFGLMAFEAKEDISTHYLINSSKEDIALFTSLSQRIPIIKPEKLLSIKKNPLIKISENKFIISDLSLLIEKICNQIVNDFWYDFLKKSESSENKSNKITTYKGHIGRFYEEYISKIIELSFSKYKYFNIFLFDDLKLKSKDGKELIDIYIRHLNKIFLCEVKSGMLADDAKLGGDITTLYNGNREYFFRRFGLNQLVESIEIFKKHVLSFDEKFQIGKSYKIYPAILVNDKVFQTPLMAQIFNTEFKSMCAKIQDNKLKIKTLTLIHINDLEKLQDSFSKNPTDLWKLLEANHSNSRFVPPFYHTISKNWTNREYPEYLLEEFKKLIDTYNPSENA